MKVSLDQSVNIDIRTLTAAERRRVSSWLGHLANWENDQHVRTMSKPSGYQNVFVLTASDDLDIAFSLDSDKKEITVLDLARPSRFKSTVPTSE